MFQNTLKWTLVHESPPPFCSVHTKTNSTRQRLINEASEKDKKEQHECAKLHEGQVGESKGNSICLQAHK